MRCVRLFVLVSLSASLLGSQAQSAPRGDGLRYPGEERQVSYDDYDSRDDRHERRSSRDDDYDHYDDDFDTESGRRKRDESDYRRRDFDYDRHERTSPNTRSTSVSWPPKMRRPHPMTNRATSDANLARSATARLLAIAIAVTPRCDAS
jgi:hypothetical protein